MTALDRREVLAALAALPALAAAPEPIFSRLEAAHGGRLGVAAHDLGSGARLAYRADQRFPMCSTFKLLLAGAVLQRVDRGGERLDRMIGYGAGDFLAYAPITRAHLSQGGMQVEALCAAAVEWSDNTAANLLLASIGGPSGLTGAIRSFGDQVTRCDRTEPALNTAIPGDPRDTTTPSAMLGDLEHLCFGPLLSPASRARLTGWLRGCQTAGGRIEAGLPSGWQSGHKTGSGAHGSLNDVAVLWPPGRAPILVAAYYTGSTAAEATRKAVLAATGRVVAGQV